MPVDDEYQITTASTFWAERITVRMVRRISRDVRRLVTGESTSARLNQQLGCCLTGIISLAGTHVTNYCTADSDLFLDSEAV